MRQHLVTQRAGTVADRREVRHEHFHTHTDTHVSHLLVVAQLIVQDDAVGLLRLRPWQREAVHGGADLVHDGNYGGSCRGTEREMQNKYILRFNVFFFITDMSLEWPQTVYLGSCLSIFGDPLKHFIGYFSFFFITSVRNFLPLFTILSVTKWEFNFPRQTWTVWPFAAISIKNID